MRIDPIQMVIHSKKGIEERSIPIGSVVGTRFASRDIKGMRMILDDFIAKGFAVSKTNPSIFRIGRYLLTQATEFEVQGPLTGGECEIVAIRVGHEVFISVGSDHADRELDPLFLDKAKQMCPHPIACTAWPYSEVRDHWDKLRLISQVVVLGHTVPFQDGSISVLVDLEYILTRPEVKQLPDPMFMYCGAIPFPLDSTTELMLREDLPKETALGVGEEFYSRLYDPVLDRTIKHRYRVVPVGDDLAERRESGSTLVHPLLGD